jgi:hypothetical protein
MKTALWLAGGICCGLAILIGLSGTGWGIPGGPIATQFSHIGFDALPRLQWLGPGKIAVALALGGVALMSAATKNAWRDTGGY